jgi:hypothetical protein
LCLVETVDEDFQNKYCDECSLKPFCAKVLNEHCAKVILKHEQAVNEFTRLMK